MKSLIANWVDGLNTRNMLHKFNLILCGSQDGFSREVFENKCYKVSQTLVIMKLKETGELIGGYNPVYWNSKGKTSNEGLIETDKSFIFKIDKNQINNSILSRVKNPEYAILHNSIAFKNTMNNIKFCEFFANFGCDLITCNSVDNVPYCYYQFCRYKNDLNLKHKDKKVHLLEELEIYKLIHV